MAKEDLVKFEGMIAEVLPNGTYKVDIKGHMVLAYISGKMRQNRISILMNDRVEIEMSPYDLSKGRIIYRYK
jgi:translation initiation factor IF-1